MSRLIHGVLFDHGINPRSGRMTFDHAAPSVMTADGVLDALKAEEDRLRRERERSPMARAIGKHYYRLP